MKLQTLINLCEGRYHVQVGPEAWTANELQYLAELGEPVIDIGGIITGSLGRPGQTNTTVTLSGGGGSGATATPVISSAGVITGFVVTNGGTGYGSLPTVTIAGDGSGATALAVLNGSVVQSITVTTGGTGYHVSPVVVNLSLPSALRRIRSDMPVKRVFDLADDPNADVQAQIYASAIAARLTAAKVALLQQPVTFVGETVTTV